MNIQKNRHVNELLFLFNSSSKVTAEELASHVDSSIRTVKNDIKYFNEEADISSICKIISHKGKGYGVIVHNEEKFNELKYQLTVLKALFRDKSIVDTSRWLFLVQKLLTNSEIKKEKLCADLYLSESGIVPHLAKACSFLNSYGITVHSNAGRGLFISGAEQDIRSCLVEVASSSYHDIDLLYPVPEFEKMIYPSFDDYQDVRHALLKILRESKMSVSDISSKKMATHLCLIKERGKMGYSPKIKTSLQNEIKETYEYSITQEIFKDETIFNYFGEQDDIEKINFARLLIINRDISLQLSKDIETILPRYIIASQKISKNILDKMKEDSYYPSIFSMDIMHRYSIDFESLFLQLYFKYYFDRLNKERLVTYVEKEEEYLSPIAKDISRTCIELLEKEFNQPIQSIESQSLAGLIDFIFRNVQYQYSKLNIALTSLQGKVVGNIMMHLLMDKYSNYIDNIEVYDLYEMRKLNFDKYSAVILQGQEDLYFSYPCKLVSVEPLNIQTKNIDEKLFDDLIIDGYSRKVLNFIKEKINIYKDTKTESLKSFFSLISYKYARSDKDQKSLYKHITNREQILSYISRAGIGVLLLDYKHTKKEYFDIYSFKHSISDENKYPVKYMLVLSIDSSRPSQEIKEINQIVQIATINQNSLSELIDNTDKLDDIWKYAMKIQFLNRI